MIRRVRPASAFVLALVALGVARCASVPPVPAAPAASVPVAYRSPREGRAAAALDAHDARRIDEAMHAIAAGDLRKAEDLVQRSGAPGSPPFRLVHAYVEIARETEEGDAAARAALAPLLKGDPSYAPAVEALADLDFRSGRFREALDGYRALARLLPRDDRATARASEAAGRLAVGRRREADEALERKDVDAARRAALSLLELEPASPSGYAVLSRAAEAGGKLEDAYTWAVKARSLAPQSEDETRRVAELAFQTHRYAEAAHLYDVLAAKDPSAHRKADQARLEFKLQNLPEVSRRAALSQRLTRAQAAALVWALVPEVRDAVPPPAPDVAVDALDRPEKTALIRAIALGFFTVAPDTHRVGAEHQLSRSDLADLLRRLAAHVARGGRLPACLQDGSALPSLVECGILTDSASRGVNGKEAALAIEAAARLAREGGRPVTQKNGGRR